MSPFLKHVKMESFGAFSGKVVGPFGPHLNVVFGPNEAGKTTTASFVRGVLFGWEEARGVRNTYKPQAADRAGSLFFDDGEGGEIELSRSRNAEGLKGDASLVHDIDRETFSTMFSLTSDELRRLRNTTDVTARLLTAGSGTGTSPAHALSVVQGRLAACTSRAASAEESLVNLGSRLADAKEEMARAAEVAESLRRKDKEFHEMEPERESLSARLSKLNARIEELTACRARIEKLAAEREEITEEHARLVEEQTQAALARRRGRHAVSRELMDMTAAEDRELRDRIDVFSDRESKCSHSVELAKSNYAASKAAYEVRLEAPDTREMELRARHQRTAQVVLSIALPLMFVGSGVPLVVHGREISSLSFTALGLGLVAMAVFLAAGALVMLFRPSKEQEARKAELQSAQWVMLQDKKKYESCLAEQEALSGEIRAFLESRGLGEASSNLRRARTILDEAKDARGDMALLQQRSQALTARLTSLEEKIARNVDALASAYTQAHLPSENATLAALDAKIARKVSQRTNLMEAFESTNRAYGELKQELATARGEHTLERGPHDLSADPNALQRVAANFREASSRSSHARDGDILLGEQKPARGVCAGERAHVAYDRGPLDARVHDGRRSSARRRLRAYRARSGPSLARHVPAALPQPAHCASARRRQRGPCDSYPCRRYSRELRLPPPPRGRACLGRAREDAPSHHVYLPRRGCFRSTRS